jgi:hypothetical protein
VTEETEQAPSTTLARPSREAYEQSGAAIQRAGFGEQSLERRDRQSTALAERAKAEIQARFIIAMQRPRDIDDVRVRILRHCKRPGFAALAEYAKPLGGKTITGPSIRFVEMALQEFGNVEPDCTIIDDDDDKRTLRISVMDLERNVTYHQDVIVEKIVERRSSTGYTVLGSRTNSYGDKVFIVRATEDDLLTKQSAIESKRIRTLGLRILPGDIVDEAMAACRGTRKQKDAADPDAARKALADAFASINVMPRHLEDFLGHPVDQSSPAELDELRMAYATVRDGEARWMDLVESKRADRGEVDEPSRTAETAASKVRDRLAAKRGKESAP